MIKKKNDGGYCLKVINGKKYGSAEQIIETGPIIDTDQIEVWLVYEDKGKGTVDQLFSYLEEDYKPKIQYNSATPGDTTLFAKTIFNKIYRNCT